VLALCVLLPLHAWAEAPVVGNHWVLAALVSLSFCLDAVRRFLLPSSSFMPGELVRSARLTLLIAYAFAAFAKLNWDFLNPAVSCAVFYQDQLVRSWNLPDLSVASVPVLGRSLAVLTVVIELAVASLLAFSRTRRFGLVLAFGFHWMLALDLEQHFWDFSSVLFAGFLLFLDDGQVAWLRQQFGAWPKWRPRPFFLPLLIGCLGAAIAVLNILPLELGSAATLQQWGHVAWWGYGTAWVGLIAASLFAPKLPSHRAYERHRVPAILLVPPILAAFNGLTPYLEIKTGFGWNMYSNLKTVAGQTNHLLLPGTWDLTGAQRELVQIVSSTDPALQRLHDEDYGLTFSEFKNYAHRFPNSAVTYRWQERVHHAPRLGDDPVVQGSVNVAAQKLISFRAVDLQAAQRCQPNFSPAR
jgi:Vitamin K-dependent gamma-carboxylase.